MVIWQGVVSHPFNSITYERQGDLCEFKASQGCVLHLSLSFLHICVCAVVYLYKYIKIIHMCANVYLHKYINNDVYM